MLLLVLTHGGPICVNLPPNETVEQVMRVVIAYMEARPALMGENFFKLALEAVRETWPCPSKRDDSGSVTR
jgi:Ssp1 endopeptidase immunity protein Rap1a